MFTIISLLAGLGLGFFLVATKVRRPREYGAVLLLGWVTLRLLLIILAPSPVLNWLSFFLLGQLGGVAVARRTGFAE